MLETKFNATIQYNTIQYNTIQYNTIQYNTIGSVSETVLNSLMNEIEWSPNCLEPSKSNGFILLIHTPFARSPPDALSVVWTGQDSKVDGCHFTYSSPPYVSPTQSMHTSPAHGFVFNLSKAQAFPSV